MISSLISGLPIRWICEKDPVSAAGSGARRTVIRGREVVPQKPSVAADRSPSAWRPGAGQHRDRHFDRDRVDVVTGHIIGSRVDVICSILRG